MDIKSKWNEFKPFIPMVLLFVVIVMYNSLLAPFFISAALSYLIFPFVKALEAKVPRVAALLIVFVILLGIVTGLALMVIPAMVNEISYFISNLPSYFENIRKYIYIDFPYREQLVAKISAESATIGNMVLKQGTSIITGGFAFVGYMISIPVFVFYLLKDREVILGFFKNFIPKAHEKRFREFFLKINTRMRGFLKGQILDFTILGIVLSIGFSFLGLKYSLIISLLCALFNLIPYIGMFFSLILIVSIGWFQSFSLIFLVKIVVFFVIVQTIESLLLAPNLIGTSAEIHPLAIIIGILVFGSTFGFLGVLFAIPAIIIIDVLIISEHITTKRGRGK